MTHEEAFLQAIGEQPEDDLPRLVYADWLTDRGDPRGEFIHTQCLLARLAEDDPRRPELEARERDLLARHQEEWLGQVWPLVSRWTFRRGFLDVLAVPARTVIEQGGLPWRLGLAPNRPATLRRVEVDLGGVEIPEEVVALVPEAVAWENLVFPLAHQPGRLLLAMAEPDDQDTLQKLQFIFNSDIDAYPAPAGQILDTIGRHYGQLPQETVTEYLATCPDVAINWPPPPGDEQPIPTLVNLIFREAIDLHATEVHIEPQADRLVVLYRVDGALVERDSLPPRFLAPLLARLRTMAGIDSAAAEAGQMGLIPVNVAGSFREIHVTITPTPGPSALLAL
jgi:uncharacterized protein (TIGR02996 family)